jgi:hypothetical protein
MLNASTRPISYESRGWCPHATYLEDAHVLSPPKAQVEFVARSLLSMSNNFALQLRREYGVIIDSDAFLGAFTMEQGGQRVKMGPWSLGPGHRPQEPSDQSTTLPTDYKLVDQEGIRVSMYKKWEKYYRHAAGHIPYAVCKANGALPLGYDNVDGVLPTGMEEEDEDEGESEIDQEEHRRPGGRPLNGTIILLVKIKKN